MKLSGERADQARAKTASGRLLDRWAACFRPVENQRVVADLPTHSERAGLGRQRAVLGSIGGKLVQREVPEPGAQEVRLKVEACGICHGDSIAKDGRFPGLKYPRVPGHEVVGTIEKMGSPALGWKVGQRVGVGWQGGHCGQCASCRSGDFDACEDSLTTGLSTDGGYAEKMIARIICDSLR